MPVERMHVFAWQIANALGYIHALSILVGPAGLCPSTRILLDGTGSVLVSPLGDPPWLRTLDADQKTRERWMNAAMAEKTCAPEILDSEGARRATYKMDMHALGILMLRLRCTFSRSPFLSFFFLVFPHSLSHSLFPFFSHKKKNTQ
jgi:hypothetical protein